MRTRINNIYFNIKWFVLDIYQKKHVIYELAKRNFHAQHKESYLGSIWVYLQPILLMLVLWFVFAVGLRVRPDKDVPFVLFLITGKIAWLFFANNITSLTSIIKRHSFLVKKGDFRLSILPIAQLLSNSIPHLALIGFAIFIGLCYKIFPTFYVVQFVYYFVGMFLLLLGLSWVTASTSLFIEDITSVISVVVQFGFFLTPIFWNISNIPERYRWIIELNPMCYIVTGYRDSLIYHIPFWSRPYQTAVFWGITLVSIVGGALVFRRLRPHFAEVI